MPRTACFARNILPLLWFTAVLVPFASASGPYVIGSANTVSADPNVTRLPPRLALYSFSSST
jgi:hypothetical protein